MAAIGNLWFIPPDQKSGRLPDGVGGTFTLEQFPNDIGSNRELKPPLVGLTFEYRRRGSLACRTRIRRHAG
jgi:hypothetical protein